MPSSPPFSIIIPALTLIGLLACSSVPVLRPPSLAEFEAAKSPAPAPKETPAASTLTALPAGAQTAQPELAPSTPAKDTRWPPSGELAQARHVMTILAVTDLAHAARFYAEVFGWPKKIDTARLVSFEIPGGVELSLYAREGFAVDTGRAPQPLIIGAITGTELYLHHPDPAQVIERLERHGARRLSPLGPRPWGDEAAYYADPDGNVIAIGRPLGKDTSPAAP